MFNKEISKKIGNFSEEYKTNYYDIDFCLKNRKAGKLILFNPYVKLEFIDKDKKEIILDEDKNIFNNRWQEKINKTDEYFNVNLETFVKGQKLWDIS